MRARAKISHSPGTLLLCGLLWAGLSGCTRGGGDGDVQPPNGGGGSSASIELVSVSQDPGGADGASRGASISADGNLVAFESVATNLVADDTNGVSDVFVYNRSAGTLARVSVDSTGQQASGPSRRPAISGDGRFVAFESDATDLVADDTNGAKDVFVRDRQTGQTTRVSVSSAGDEGDGDSSHPAISVDGRYVAFQSAATNLVAGDTNGALDVFVHDRQSGETVRASVDSAGVEGDDDSTLPSLSAAGTLVAFTSAATNLVAGDTNASLDVFVRDLTAETTVRVSVSSGGTEGDAGSDLSALSADGRYVAFVSEATDLVPGDTNGTADVFVHDRQTGATSRVSVSSVGLEADGPSGAAARPSISSNGRFVVFTSAATNLVESDTNAALDVFRHDRTTGETRRVNLTAAGAQGAGDTVEVVTTAVSADGTRIAFHTADDGLVPDDANGEVDVLVRTEPAPASLSGQGPGFGPAGAVYMAVSGLELAQGSPAPEPVVRLLHLSELVAWRARLEPPAPWLEVTPWTGGGPSFEGERIELACTPQGLAPGTYRTHLGLLALDGGELLDELLIELRVRD